MPSDEEQMKVRIDEIGDRIYRISTFLPQAAEVAGLTFNQFLLDGEEPLLFHCWHRKMFPVISAAVSKIISVDRLRWLAFGHFRG
jgi:flavorubredoxin